MTDIFIGSKKYTNIEKQPDFKLAHMLQLVEIEIANYEKHLVNYPPDRLERFGKPFLKILQSRKDAIVGVQLSRVKLKL